MNIYGLSVTRQLRKIAISQKRLIGLNHVTISRAVGAKVNVGSCITSEKPLYEGDVS